MVPLTDPFKASTTGQITGPTTGPTTGQTAGKRPELQRLNPIGTQQDPLGLTPLPEDNRQRFLRFTLDQKSDTLLPLHQIVEVMQLHFEDIFPVPDMPSCILGVCSWQGETLWLVDLNHLVGYEPLYQQSQISSPPVAIVVNSSGCSLGLVVEQVGDVDFFDEDNIQMETGLCPPELEPFVLGYCPQQGGTVLNMPAIVTSPLWQSHQSGNLTQAI
ncbi:MAG: chemotaxis protein CheW [Cyanobacteria bacterium P01_A01_bin.116]